MNRKKRIEELLRMNFAKLDFQLHDRSSDHSGHNNFDGSQESHFQLIIKNYKLYFKKRIETHRAINLLLKNEYNIGLHSLEITLRD